jgi:hypothetical protein
MDDAYLSIQKELKKDPVLRRWSSEIMQEVAMQDIAADRTDFAAATLWLSLAGVILMIARCGVAHLQGLSELDLARRQEELVEELASGGIDPLFARKCVDSTIKNIRNRSPKSDVIEQLSKLASFMIKDDE